MFEQENKISFFEEEVEETYMMDKPPHNDHVACSTPNPPWWCEEQGNAVNIDTYIPFLILIGIVMILVRVSKIK